MNLSSFWKYPKKVEEELSKKLPERPELSYPEDAGVVSLPKPEPSSRWEGEVTPGTARDFRDIIIYNQGEGKPEH